MGIYCTGHGEEFYFVAEIDGFSFSIVEAKLYFFGARFDHFTIFWV